MYNIKVSWMHHFMYFMFTKRNIAIFLPALNDIIIY